MQKSDQATVMVTGRPLRRQKTKQKDLFGWFVNGLLMLWVVFTLLPFAWIISTSLRLPRESFTIPPAFFPTSFQFSNYLDVFERLPFLAFYLNSIKVSTLIVLGVVIVSSMAAYAFSRLQFPGRNVLFILILTGLMVPGQVTIIPQFILISKLGWMDSHTALIVPALISPIGIFLIRQMMMTIPKSFEEAAYIDGAGRVRVFLSIIVPMSFPAITVTAVLTFIGTWNEFFRPLIFLNTYEKMTLPLGMVVLQGAYGTGNLAAILAGVTMSLLAPLLFYIFGQKYLVDGLTLGGTKG